MAKQNNSNYDPWTVIKYPSMSEKSIRFIETENKMIFIVNERVSKSDVKRAIETAFNVKVDSVNTVIDTENKKKAYVKLSKDSNASDIATRLGII